MKTRIIYLCLLVILSTTGCIPTQTIKGDGNITTENIPVSEYDCLELEGGGMVVNYTQSEAPEGLEIKTDRNIFEKYEFNVENHKLKIRPKKRIQETYEFPSDRVHGYGQLPQSKETSGGRQYPCKYKFPSTSRGVRGRISR